MRTAPKVLLILGGVFLLIGIIGFGIGINSATGIEEDMNKYEFENAMNGTMTIDDNDGQGDIGVTFWVKGEYTDDDGNGVWDICDNTNVVITSNPDVNSDWDDATLLDGKFYYEVNYEANNNESNCAANNLNKLNDRTEQGLVKIGRACWGCFAGELSFESNQSVWVTYDDQLGEDLIEGLVETAIGFFAGVGSFCCGVILLIIGIILAFTMKDEDQIVYTMPQSNQMSMQQPGVWTAPTQPQKVQTGMSQPVFDEIGKGGL